MFAMAAMVEGTGSVVVGYFVAKWAHRDFMGPSIAVLGTLVCVGSVGMAWTGNMPLLIVFALMHGVGFSLVPFVWTLPYRLPGFGARDIAVGIGFIETCLLAGGAIGPALTGFLQDSTGGLAVGDDHHLLVLGGDSRVRAPGDRQWIKAEELESVNIPGR